MKYSVLGTLSTLTSVSIANVQVPFSPGQLIPTEPSLNATTLDLNSLNSEFTVLGHPVFPKYSVRIKKTHSDWCDSSAASYTGYIDTTEARHIFFYFFESRSDPDSDDVILWTTGGPGCSSSLGLFMEMGPCQITDDNGPKRNPHSWNENANIFFIDQPIGLEFALSPRASTDFVDLGVGFSYADYGEYVSTTEEGAEDIAAFVAIFFAIFSKFSGRAFHMAGSSYGVRI
jgi:cathepsin A (carboxypeptidase C)